MPVYLCSYEEVPKQQLYLCTSSFAHFSCCGVASLTSHRRGSKLLWYEISKKFREVRGYLQLGLGMW